MVEISIVVPRFVHRVGPFPAWKHPFPGASSQPDRASTTPPERPRPPTRARPPPAQGLRASQYTGAFLLAPGCEGRGVVAGQPELEEEQRFLDRAHEGLDAMRADSQRMLESVLDLGRGGTFQSRTERDIVVRTSLARLAQLDIGDQALCFGRIDVAPSVPGAETESFHIGRLAVSDTAH